MKTLTTTILAITLLVVAVCSAQEKSDKVQTPKVNLHMAALQGNIEGIQQHIKAG